MTNDLRKVHPRRRRRKRGKRGGQKHRPAPLVLEPPKPEVLSALRSRLSRLASAHG